MVNTPLDMKYVYKRERFLEKRKSIAESSVSLDISSIDNCSKDYYKLKIESFLKQCCSYKDAISILESLYLDDNFEVLEMATQRVINDILPMVENADLPDCISLVESSNIGSINKDRIIESAKNYKRIDRIRKNHKNISKIFEVSKVFTNGYSERTRCFKVCEMVDTYNLSKYIKFNIALEEIAFSGFENGNRMPDNVMVEHVADYFLMISDNTKEDIESYKSAIASSSIISESADENVEYLMNHESTSQTNSSYWLDRLNKWKVSTPKNINALIEIARENYNNINILNYIINTINEYCAINNIEFDTMSIFKEDNNCINGEEAKNIIDFIEENHIENSTDLIDHLHMIWEAESNDDIYANGPKDPETFTSNEIDKFKMHNLIVDSQSVGEFLDQLEKTSMKESPVNVERILDCSKIKLDESNLIENIDSNGYVSLSIRSYSYNGSSKEIHDLLESSIKCINNILYNRNSCAYYILSENTFDIFIRSKYKVILSESQDLSRSFSKFDKFRILNIHRFTESLENIYNSKLQNIIDKLHNNRDIAANITPQEASILCDILSPFNESQNHDGFLDEFIDLCEYEANPKFDQIKKNYSKINTESFSFDDDNLSRIDFCAEVLDLNEAEILDKAIGNIKNATKDLGNKINKISNPSESTEQLNDVKKDEKENPSDKQNKNSIKKNNNSSTDSDKEDEDIKDDKKELSSEENKKAINSLNDVKLAWQGVKAKLKGASAKEQEMSRDLDMEFNHLLKSIKTTYGTDHREEIITGEVNHSLSKVIKIGIGLAGIGVLAGSAVVPVIGTIALFARSKYLTYKEKKLILDEIDIELQVLDREINRAEQSGSTKKYRQLLTIQKNLQRRRQEIYYGMAKKGQRIPMQSTTGMRSRE